MIYKFNAFPFAEGKRIFIEIPFNVWEETGLKGNIPCRVFLPDVSFACKLVPKGQGRYFIPVPRSALPAQLPEEEYEIGMEPIEALTRINHDSPYSKDHPIRKIEGIDPIPIQSGCCGQCCVAMLAGVSLSDVLTLMGKGHASWSKILEALDYYGISHASKAVYPRGSAIPLPACCIVSNDNRFLLWYQGAFCGTVNVDPAKTVSCIEIFTE